MTFTEVLVVLLQLFPLKAVTLMVARPENELLQFTDNVPVPLEIDEEIEPAEVGETAQP